jgi:hypothetical protein
MGDDVVAGREVGLVPRRRRRQLYNLLGALQQRKQIIRRLEVDEVVGQGQGKRDDQPHARARESARCHELVRTRGERGHDDEPTTTKARCDTIQGSIHAGSNRGLIP